MKHAFQIFDLKKLVTSLLASPFIVMFAPYSELIESVLLLALIDILLGLPADAKEKYNSVHPAAVMRTFKSRKLLSKVGVFAVFFIGLAAAHLASPLLAQFGVEEFKAGLYFCSAYGIYEFTSILENCGRLGLPIAKPIVQWVNSKFPLKPEEQEKK